MFRKSLLCRAIFPRYVKNLCHDTPVSKYNPLKDLHMKQLEQICSQISSGKKDLSNEQIQYIQQLSSELINKEVTLERVRKEIKDHIYQQRKQDEKENAERYSRELKQAKHFFLITMGFLLVVYGLSKH